VSRTTPVWCPDAIHDGFNVRGLIMQVSGTGGPHGGMEMVFDARQRCSADSEANVTG
jgi:hypothetical protein